MPQQQGEWEDIEWEDITEEEPVITPPSRPRPNIGPAQQPSSLMSGLTGAWNAVTTPLTNAPSRFAESVMGAAPQGGIMDAIRAIPDVARGMVNEPVATIKGGLQGGLQGVADLISQETSPLALASTAIGMPRPVRQGIRKGISGIANRIMGKADEVIPPKIDFTPSSGGTISQQIADQRVREAERIRGTPEDIPQNTVAQRLEAERKAIEAAELTPPSNVSPMFNPRGRTGMTGTAQTPPKAVTVWLKNPTPEKVKQAAEQGYKFGGKVREDGSFQMVKSETPLEIPILESEVGIARPTPKSSELARDLQGAKPRFNIGQNSYEPQFSNDLDKALFIIAQKTPSRRNADYLRFVMQQTGMNEAQAIQAGQRIRSQIKDVLKGEEPGIVRIPRLFNPQEAKFAQSVEKNIPPKSPTQSIFEPPKPPKPPVGDVIEDIPEPGHLGQLADVKKSSAIAEAINFPRGVMASWDFSAPLRQGLPLIHKKAWWTSFDDMFKSWGSERAFQAVQKSIADKPLFKPRVGPQGKPLPSFAEDAGLKLTDLTDLSKREEAVMSTWAEKVPGVRRSNRAYVAFLNKLRADTFEDLIKKGKVFGADGETNLPLAREIANFVNTASGRGSLGKLEQSAVALNSTFFSPRLIASRLQMLNPHYYWSANPQVRKEALKSLFAVAATGGTIGQLGKMAGGTVEADPTSSDFGKIKIGNTRIDPFGGFQQYVVLANRLLQGRTKSSISGREYNLGEKFGRPTKLDVLGRFAEGKLHPVWSFATGLLRGKDFTGQPFNVPQELANRVLPIIVQDVIELANEDPSMLPVAVPAAFGMGIQSYESQ